MAEHQWPPGVATGRGAHFRSDGKPKRRLTQRRAEAIAARTGSHAYRCVRCNGWHTGNRREGEGRG